MRAVYQTHILGKVAAFVAAFFLGSCVTLTDAPDALKARIEQALSVCANPALLSAFERRNITQIIGPHKCVEKRSEPYENRDALVSADRQTYFELDNSCTFTLLGVDEVIIDQTIVDFAMSNGWKQRQPISVGGFKRSRCNGFPRNNVDDTPTVKLIVDISSNRMLAFRWLGPDEARNTLEVSVWSHSDSLCEPEFIGKPWGCFEPEYLDD